MLAKIAYAAVGTVGWAGLTVVSLNPDAGVDDFRFMFAGMAIVASIHFLLRCYVTPGREHFERGREHGRREVIAEMNGMARRHSPDPIQLAGHRRRGGVRV